MHLGFGVKKMELIKTNLKRAREGKTMESRNRRESDILWNLRGIISVWADDDGITHKELYALEILNRIKELNSEFEEDSKLRMSPAEKKYRGI
tara:strand:- start:170 stop:448 length:279 start_codon:yes stop_codon:yes gene_type:complete